MISSLYLNTRKSCGFPIPGSVQGQVGQGLEHSNSGFTSLCKGKEMFTVSVPAACYPGERWRAGVAQLDLQEGILSVLKGYFKPSSLSLALITGPEPARGGRMF